MWKHLSWLLHIRGMIEIHILSLLFVDGRFPFHGGMVVRGNVGHTWILSELIDLVIIIILVLFLLL